MRIELEPGTGTSMVLGPCATNYYVPHGQLNRAAQHKGILKCHSRYQRGSVKFNNFEGMRTSAYKEKTSGIEYVTKPVFINLFVILI